MSHATAAVVTGDESRRPFRERLRQARSKRNEDWWSIVFGGPIGQVLAALVVDVPWITPNRLTWLSFAAKLAAVPLLLDGRTGAMWAAIALLQANVVLDCMDGILARARRASSVLGGFLDKLTDATGLSAVMGAFAVRVARDTGDGWFLVAAAAATALWLCRIYAYWIVAYYEKDKGIPKPTAGGELRVDFGALRYGERLRYYGRESWRIVMFSEADAYFWIALALATGWARPIGYLYVAGLAGFSLALIAKRLRRAVAIDAWQEARP